MKPIKYSLFGLWMLLFLCGCQVSNSDRSAEKLLPGTDRKAEELRVIEVPRAKSPAVDGVIESEEWESAAIKPFSDNSELLALSDDEYLYLGIREHSGEMIAVNVFIYHENEISILHSSAALGTANYQKQDNIWIKTRDFEWCCRQTNNSESAIKEQKDQLMADDWVASNSRTGTPNEVEYQIKIKGEVIQLAISFLRASDPGLKIPWPADLDDGCTLPTPGGFPLEMAFDIDRWGTIYFETSDK